MHLPEGNVYSRERVGHDASTKTWLLLNIESRMRDFLTQQVNLWSSKGSATIEPTYLRLGKADEDEAEEGAVDDEQQLAAMEFTRSTWFSNNGTTE